MKRTILAAIIALLAQVASPYAAGPFDGQWKGGSPGIGRGGCPATEATVSIVDGKLTGKYQFRNYSFNISGTVSADGSVTGKWSTNPFTGKIIGTHFAGTYDSKECGTGRPITLDKAG